MIDILSVALALSSLPGLVPAVLPAMPPAVPQATAASLDELIAEVLGKALVIWCRPSSPEHGITMLSSEWSKQDELHTITAQFRWYGLWSELPYTAKIRIDLSTGGERQKSLSIGYEDDCLAPVSCTNGSVISVAR